MKITLINGSPKVKDSASGLILNELKIFLNNSEDEAERNISISEYNFRKNKLDSAVIEEVVTSDILVFIFPLYVDGVPSHLLRLPCSVRRNLKKYQRKEY